MAKKILLEVMTPERLLIREMVDELVAPGSEGEFGVRPGHCHFFSTLRIGELRYRQEDRWNHLAVIGGYTQVEPERVTVLADLAERAEEIDLERAEAAAREAEAHLAASKKREEMEAARLRLEKALLRVRMGRKGRRG
jgi:F-type H+-transporting ATPase subunit epsilon